MKRIWKLVTTLPLLASLLVGCNKFLDVQPAGTLPEQKQFADVQGFRDAMYGVYASMAKPALYGSNLTFGFVDKLGQMLLVPNSEHKDSEIANYSYMSVSVRPIIDEIWSTQYQVISYVNLILDHLDATDLQHTDLQLIKGEAHGVRAFLHFDLLRLFSEDYLVNNSSRGIPYANSFQLQNHTLYNVGETYKLIIEDLLMAEELLSNDEQLDHQLNKDVNSIYQADRRVHFNKWAVKATLARVYYHMGDYINAGKYAEEVIANAGNFSLAKHTNLDEIRRSPGGNECIFRLNTTYLNDLVRDTFLKTIGSGVASEGRRDLKKLYEVEVFTATNIDKRYDLYYSAESTGHAFTRLLKSNEEHSSNPLNGIQLIRLPEMYYIYAEVNYDNNRSTAIAILNQVRESRGLEPIAVEKVNTKEAFMKEMLRERMREMPGDGQVFFYYKHRNESFTAFDGTKVIEPSSAIFVLPWPQNELDFGNM